MLYMSNFTVFMHIWLPTPSLGLLQTWIHFMEASSTWMIHLLVSSTSCAWALKVAISDAWAWMVNFFQPWRLLTRITRTHTRAAIAHRHLGPRPPHLLGRRTSSHIFCRVTFHHQHLLEIGDNLVDGHPPTSAPLKLSEDDRVSSPLLLPCSPFNALLWHLLPTCQAWELNEEPDEAEDDGEDGADGEQEQPPLLPHALALASCLLWLRWGRCYSALALEYNFTMPGLLGTPRFLQHTPPHIHSQLFRQCKIFYCFKVWHTLYAIPQVKSLNCCCCSDILHMLFSNSFGSSTSGWVEVILCDSSWHSGH